jgi:ankyrin repeat protein
MLLEAGAKPDAVDTKKNTTLHYAAGCACPRHARALRRCAEPRVRCCRYGRADYAAILMDAGASIAARNETGKTPLDLVKVNAQNPVNSNEAVMKRLRGGSHFDDV